MELVISTYSGDEILGCGILMTRRPKDFFVAIISAGAFQYSEEFSDIRGIDLILWKKAETIKALKAIGIDKMKFLGHLAIYKKEVLEDLIQLNEKIQPSVIYFPHKDTTNVDRKRVGDACINLKTNAIKVMYQIPSVTNNSSHSIKIGETEKKIKDRLIQIYRSQKQSLQAEYKKGCYTHHEYFWKL